MLLLIYGELTRYRLKKKMITQHPHHPGAMLEGDLISQTGDVSKAAIPADAQPDLAVTLH